MTEFKFGSRKVFENWLLAPKGYKFNLDVIKSSDIFPEESVATMFTTFNDRSLKWSEEHINLSADVGQDFWIEYLNVENGCLVKE